jgi:hypothetical protein
MVFLTQHKIAMLPIDSGSVCRGIRGFFMVFISYVRTVTDSKGRFIMKVGTPTSRGTP